MKRTVKAIIPSEMTPKLRTCSGDGSPTGAAGRGAYPAFLFAFIYAIALQASQCLKGPRAGFVLVPASPAPRWGCSSRAGGLGLVTLFMHTFGAGGFLPARRQATAAPMTLVCPQ